MDIATLKSQFDQDGFVVIREFLSAEELTDLQDNLDRYIRDIVPTLPDREAFYEDKSRPETLKQMHRLERDDYFAHYLDNPRWKEVAEGLLGEPVLDASGAEWFNKPPGLNHATPPHQDNFYFCLNPPQVLTMWLALDTIDVENGCLRYVRGSHLRGVRPHCRTDTLGFSQTVEDYGDADRTREVAVPARPGDVLIHHGNMIHRADANYSNRHRRSFGMVFRGESSRRDEEAFRRYQEAVDAQHKEKGLGEGEGK